MQSAQQPFVPQLPQLPLQQQPVYPQMQQVQTAEPSAFILTPQTPSRGPITSEFASPAPQPPLTAFDLRPATPVHRRTAGTEPTHWGSSFATRREPRDDAFAWGGQEQSRKQSFAPSHLTHLPLRSNMAAERSSPNLEKSVSFARDTRSGSPGALRRSSSHGKPPAAEQQPMWGSGFGAPRLNVSVNGGSGSGGNDYVDWATRRQIMEDDAPPVESFYDIRKQDDKSNKTKRWIPATAGLDVTAPVDDKPPTPKPEQIDEKPTEVILFGFPPSLTHHMLEIFSRYGTILRSHASNSCSTGTKGMNEMGANWLKITYADPMAASRAVAANGTLVGGQYMVGCVYADPEEARKTITKAMTEPARTPTPTTTTTDLPTRLGFGAGSVFGTGASKRVAFDDAMDVDVEPVKPATEQKREQYGGMNRSMTMPALSNGGGMARSTTMPNLSEQPLTPGPTGPGKRIEVIQKGDAIFADHKEGSVWSRGLSSISSYIPAVIPAVITGTSRPLQTMEEAMAAAKRKADEEVVAIKEEKGWIGKTGKRVLEGLFGF
ncbi:hypothetical protein YB2330_005363 [Saitoella coloradoensis]